MKPLFIKKNGTVSKVSGIIMNLIPSYTLAEYNALTHKPLLWIRTDIDYAQIPSEDVSYGSGSVKDALDATNTVKYIDAELPSTTISAGGYQTVNAPRFDKNFIGCILVNSTSINVIVVGQPIYRASAAINKYTATIFNPHTTELTVSGYIRWFYAE